jgi:hypothetical protein
MSDDPTRTLERRVSAALHAEVDDITPGSDSLGPIRGRARAARHRRRVVAAVTAAVAAAALVVSVPAFRDDDGSNVSTQRDPSLTTSTPSPAPSEAEGRALWPDPAGPEQFDDPAAAARSFVAAVFGVEDAPLSEVRTMADGEAEIDVFDRSETGTTLDSVASTLSLARLDGGHWYVTGARSEDVEIASPAPGASAVSPLTVTGEGRGYEGTILVEVRERAAGAPVLADGFDTAGAGEALAPFSVALTLPGADDGAAGAILVARDTSGAELGMPHLTAQLVWLPGAPGSPPASPGPSGGGVTPTTSSDPDAADFELGSQPLWPFRTYAEAEDWRATSGDGHQPWHADAVETASLFTTSYLGFSEIGEITSTDVRADEAWIGVGYRAEAGGTPSTSAVVHLVRFGPHADSPWEVVGTRDTTLTLETPRYGTRVSSPATVGGTVTGVDECLVVQVREPSSSAPLGEAPCLPAGGEGFPWQTTVAWSGASDPALTIVVSTGGHAQGVERFAVTGVPG